MCGRFAQAQTREAYLAFLAEEAERDIPWDPEPIGRYNVAPGTKVLLLSERNEQLHLDPVHWGYAPGWWDKSPLINARVETAATSRMFKPLWQHGRAICFADGWFEWKKVGDKKTALLHPAEGWPADIYGRYWQHPLRTRGQRRRIFAGDRCRRSRSCRYT